MANQRIHTVYGAAGRRFRTTRLLHFARAMGLTASSRVLDVGGAADTWFDLRSLTGISPSVTLLNLDRETLERAPATMGKAYGDARAIPFDAGDFDVVYSNSVIEHVGSFADQLRMASEIRRLGCSYWVQTPNYWFPVEPHFLGVGVQFLPPRAARTWVRYGSLLSLVGRASDEEIDATLAEVRLLKSGELRELFPDAAIVRERNLMTLGLTKSLIAMRRDSTH